MRVMCAPSWREGSPSQGLTFEGETIPDWIERSPRLVKLIELESFEASLDSLELSTEKKARLAGQMNLLGDDYMVKYFLSAETQDANVFLSTEALVDPFSYRLRSHTPEGTKEVTVDLVETFNLLMGFHVVRIWNVENASRKYTLVEVRDGDRSDLIVWRNTLDLDPDIERKFLDSELELASYGTIWVNGDSALPGAQSLDAEFKSRMLERDPNFA